MEKERDNIRRAYIEKERECEDLKKEL